MASFDSSRRDILIGGAGIAAAAVAMRLCKLGFRPMILATGGHILPGIEAIPEAALPLVKELELEPVLRKANSVVVDGFENHWNVDEPELRTGKWIHVERSLLAKAAIVEAVHHGAVLRLCRSLPKLSSRPSSVHIALDGVQLHFEAAIDATGRSAVWSRPVRRRGKQLANIFKCPQELSLRGRVVRLGKGWAYRIGVEGSTTVAVLTPQRGSQAADAKAQDALGIARGEFEHTGRRPAFPQWSENPVQQRRLAIGDAALAYDPLAGQGIRFALSSALTAAAVVNTWRHSPGGRERAAHFYYDYVDQSRRQHLEFIGQLRAPKTSAAAATGVLHEVVVFSGQTKITELQVESGIVTGEAVVLPGGAAVRWVGGVDLLRVRDLARSPVRPSEMAERLASPECSPTHITAVLGWCMRHGLISAAADTFLERRTSVT